MNEEARLLSGKLFNPGNDELKKLKENSHNLCHKYNGLKENKTKKRNKLIEKIFKQIGEGAFIQGPMYIHYGVHTVIGKNFFGNFNLTIQDDGMVTIGDDCRFGPNVTIVTPIHPLIPEERLGVKIPGSSDIKYCYAKPVNIGDNCWLGANVTVCSGVTIGNGAVIGAGSVVVKDIPENTFAAGNPCQVIRDITEKDSVFLLDLI